MNAIYLSATATPGNDPTVHAVVAKLCSRHKKRKRLKKVHIEYNTVEPIDTHKVVVEPLLSLSTRMISISSLGNIVVALRGYSDGSLTCLLPIAGNAS